MFNGPYNLGARRRRWPDLCLAGRSNFNRLRVGFTVRNRGEGRKPFWATIGSAWTNKDESFTLRLDALPIDGEIVVRPRKSDGGEEVSA